MKSLIPVLLLLFASVAMGPNCDAQSAQQLEKWRKRFPAADSNKDGVLSLKEARAFQAKMRGGSGGNTNARRSGQGAPRQFDVDPGWDSTRFPESAVSYKTPAEIKSIYQRVKPGNQPTVVSYPTPSEGNLRVVGTGHSFMAPGYNTLPLICKAAGRRPMFYTHTGGGITGSARYKWEQENGIFQFAGKPTPKLLASISNAGWDAMMFGPYFNDRPVYYSCWIDFCLQHSPDMKFYLSDAWPQLSQLGRNPASEDYFTAEVFDRMGQQRRQETNKTMEPLRMKYPDKVFVLPTSDAMVLAAQAYLRGELPGIEGVHKVIGKKTRSLWRDQLGHLGPGFDRLEGYVFYATLYGESPERIEQKISFRDRGSFPSPALDKQFRKIAWQAVVNHPHSGIVDKNKNGLHDGHETDAVQVRD